MKKLVIIIILLPLIVFPATYTTITIDGTNDFDTGTERFSSTSGTGIYGYVTWDASYLYIGYSGSTNSGTMTDGNRVYHIYIDTDPQTTATNGTGTTDGETWRTDPTLPFTANYHYVFKTQDNSEIKRIYSESSWGSTSFTTSNWKGTGYWECSIERSGIGSPSQIYLLMYVEEDWAGGYVQGGIPSDIFTDNTSQGSQTFTSGQWLGFNLTAGETPNDAGNFDQSLAVELSTFSTQSSSKGVKLSWTTDSEIENHGFIILRKSDAKEWAELASFTNNPALEGQGSTTQATDYYYIDAKVKEGLSYSYQLVDVDYQGNKTFHKDHIETITYVNPGKDTKPDALKVVKLYPNPFNPTVTLTYDLAEANDLNVSIYNLAGEQVWNHVRGNHPAGQNYTLTWNGNDMANTPLPSGIYLVNIQAGAQFKSEKVTLLR